MGAVFPEPGSAALIDEMVAIMLDSTPEVMVAQERELDWSRTRGLLAHVSCPTLLIHGDSDPTLSVKEVVEVAVPIPGARLELIPGGGHRPDIRSPEVVDPLLEAFVLPNNGS
jgi:3-oxoadipate enol-lactonase